MEISPPDNDQPTRTRGTGEGGRTIRAGSRTGSSATREEAGHSGGATVLCAAHWACAAHAALVPGAGLAG